MIMGWNGIEVKEALMIFNVSFFKMKGGYDMNKRKQVKDKRMCFKKIMDIINWLVKEMTCGFSYYN